MVDAAERNTIGLEGTSNKQDTLRELTEKDNTLAPEATGEKNEYGARLERVAILCRMGCLAGLS